MRICVLHSYKCPLCGSTDIIFNGQEYYCKFCGCVINHQSYDTFTYKEYEIKKTGKANPKITHLLNKYKK